MNKISCIICAYNEESRIGNVLQAVSEHPLLSEIIVVDDGSQDRTRDMVKAYQDVRLISHDTNKGKSRALVTGLSYATSNIIMMLDADLVGLTRDDVARLADPVLSGCADVTMSLRQNSLFIYRWIGIDYVSGERVFKKDLLSPEHLENIKKLPGYGVESYMNGLIIGKKLRLKIIPWPNVRVTNKSGKIGLWKGIMGEIHMIRQIVAMMTVRGVIRQIHGLRSLIIR